MYAYLYCIVINGVLTRSCKQIRFLKLLTRLEMQPQLRAFTNEYRSMALLCNLANQSICLQIVPATKYGCILAAMLFLHSGFEMTQDAVAVSADGANRGMNAIMGTGFVLCGSYLYTFLVIGSHILSEVWKNFNTCIWALGECQSGMNMQAQTKNHINFNRVVRSLAPLRFRVGSFYFLERSAKMTLAGMLVFGTARLFIAFRH